MPVSVCFAGKQIGDSVRDKAPAVKALINDQCVLMMVGIHAAIYFAGAIISCVGHMYVSNAAAREAIYHFAAGLYPVVVHQLLLAGNGPYGVGAGAIGRGPAVYGYARGFIHPVFKEEVGVVGNEHRLAFNGNNVIAFADFDALFGEW